MLVRGYASTPDMDQVRDVVLPGAFDQTIRQRGLSGPKGIKLLWHHRHDRPLGVITKLEQRPRGLWIEAVIDEGISWGRDVAAAVKANGGLSFSIGYTVQDADVGKGPDGLPHLILKRLGLLEVSVVVFPCNEEAVMVGFGNPSADPVASAIEELAAELRAFNEAMQ